MADDKKPASKKITLPQADTGFPAERNLMLIFLLMGAMLLVTPYFYPNLTAPPAGKKGLEVKTSESPAKAAVPTPPSPAMAAAVATAAKPAKGAAAVTGVAASKQENFSIDTAQYRILFSNTGGTVVSWQLKKYKDSQGKPLELVNPRALVKLDAPFSLAIPTQQDLTYVNQRLFQHKTPPEGFGIDFEYADAKVRVQKTFRVSEKDYRVQVTSEVVAGGATVPHNLTWRGGFGDLAAFNASSFGHTVRYDTSLDRLLISESKEALENQPKVDIGTFTFIGIDDPFFAAVFLPKQAKTLEHRTYVDTVQNYVGVEEKLIGTSVGGDGRNDLTLFVGPKDLDELRKVSPQLEQLIDWGRYFGWLAKPMFQVMHWVHERVEKWSPGGSWGWAIVLITVAINFVMLPLKVTTLRSAKKMQALKPEMDRITKKYAGVGMSDPQSAKKNEELMELYKKHGVNPAGGCVPLLIQFPFLIALYTVLTVMIDLRQAKWLWVTDLSQPETLAIRLLPLMMIASQFILQKMTPTPGQDPAQAKMMMFMPLMFGFMFYGQSSGLVLYWLVGNLVALGQQWAFNKFIK